MQEHYGPDVARIYRQVEGLPQFALDSEPLPVLRYRRLAPVRRVPKAIHGIVCRPVHIMD